MGKGLSTLLGTIILIGIALAAGVSIFNIANQYAVVGFSKTEYSVLEASLIKDSNDRCFLYVKLTNTGTNHMERAELEISADKNGIPESFRIDKTSKLQLTTDDSREFLIWTSNKTLSIRENMKSNSKTVEIDSIIFTNMTGKVTSASSTDLQNKLQPLFNQCGAWKDCVTYTADVLGMAADNSQSAASHSLMCRESDRI
jgi:hypothetical protein